MKRPNDVNDLQVLWAIRDLPDLNWFERSILFYFVTLIGNNGSCWYSLHQLVEKTTLSRSTLQRTIKSLESKSFLQISRPVTQGRGHANEYFLNYPLILNYTKVIHKGVSQNTFNEKRVSHRTPLRKKGCLTEHRKGVCETPQDIHKERQYLRETEKLLSEDFFPDEKLAEELLSRRPFSQEEADFILDRFRRHHIDAGTKDNIQGFNERFKSWYMGESRKPGFLSKKKSEENVVIPTRSTYEPIPDVTPDQQLRNQAKMAEVMKTLFKSKGVGKHDEDNGRVEERS